MFTIVTPRHVYRVNGGYRNLQTVERLARESGMEVLAIHRDTPDTAVSRAFAHAA